MNYLRIFGVIANGKTTVTTLKYGTDRHKKRTQKTRQGQTN